MDRILEWLGGTNGVEETILVGVLVFARVAPVTMLAPWLAMRATPVVIRVTLGLALTVTLAPIATESAIVPDQRLAVFVLTLREALIGSVFAVVTALPFHALDWAGRLVDTYRGANLAEIIAPPTGERTSPLGDLKLMMGIAIFVVLGGHGMAIGAFATTLSTVPIGQMSAANNPAMIWGAVELVGAAIALSAAIAAPAAVAIVLVEVGLGLVARTAPQVPVFFAGMPLRAATGLGATLLALSLLVGGLPSVFRNAVDQASELVSTAGGGPSP